jgi:acyl phosphate:glycerol-3-phosphate acyltransferase
MIGKVFLVALQAYVLGSIPFGYLLYRIRQGGDVRSTGSGSIGATNVLRGAGTAAGAATLLLDAAKGYVAVMLAGFLTGHAPEWMSLAAVLAILGHIFPVFLKFRGGKGVATGFGAFLAIAPFPVLWVMVIFVIVAAGWRYVSLASMLAVAAFPFVLLAYGGASPYVLAAAFLGAVLIISRHSSNIRRLLVGTEKVLRAPL